MRSRTWTIFGSLCRHVARRVLGPAALVATVTGLTLAIAQGHAAAQTVVSSCTGSPEGALCDDDNPCTVDDVCRFGLCVGQIAPEDSACTDGNQCTLVDRCVLGSCIGAAAPEGTACSDLNECTEGDSCVAGSCTAGRGRTCTDGNPCTIDQCISPVGCVFAAIPMCVVPEPPPPVEPPLAEPPLVEPPVVEPGPVVEPTSPTDGGRDGTLPLDGGSDAPTVDAAPTTDAPVPFIRYTIEGGACVCSAPGRSSGPPALVWLGVVAIAVRARRRGKGK